LLAADRWHSLLLEGRVNGDSIHYESFTIDGETQELGIDVALAADAGQEDRVAVGVQLDGNARQDRYELQLDELNVVVREE
jgi:hypothetical protein